MFRLPIALAGSLSASQGRDGVVHYKAANGDDSAGVGSAHGCGAQTRARYLGTADRRFGGPDGAGSRRWRIGVDRVSPAARISE